MDNRETDSIPDARKLAGAKIGELIDEVYATRKAFSDISGISTKKLSDIAHGRKRIDAELVDIFAKFLNEDREYFLTLERSFDANQNNSDPIVNLLDNDSTPRIIVRSPDGTTYFIPIEAPLDTESALRFSREIGKQVA